MYARYLLAVILVAAGFPPTCVQAQIRSIPQIDIVSPVDGTKYQARADVSVAVQGMDVPDVTHVVQLFQGGTLVGSAVLDPLAPTQTHPVVFQFTFDVNGLRAGRYTFVAMVDDVSSAPMTIVVKRQRPRNR
jgi:hypothetical protein